MPAAKDDLMRMCLRLVAAFVLAALGADPIVTAQQPQQQRPITAGWVFTPSIGIGGAWDSNVLLVDTGGVPPRDYATPVDPSVSLDYHGRRTDFSSAYEGTFLMYQDLTQLNSSEQRLRSLVQHRATKHFSFFVEENYAKAPTTDALQVAGVPFYRVGSRTNTLGGGIQADLTRHTVLRSTYTYRDVDFAADPLFGTTLQGGHSHEWTASVTQALSPRLGIGGEYEQQRAIVSDGVDTFNIYTAGATVGYQLTGTVSVSGMAGVSRLTGGATPVERTGPAVRAGIARHTPRLTLSAAYERSFIPSYGFGGTYQNEAYDGNAHIPFARGRGYVDGSIAWFNNQPVEITQPELQTWFLSGTLGYYMTRWLRLEGYLSRTQQDSHLPGGQLGRSQVGFRMVAVKPMKIH